MVTQSKPCQNGVHSVADSLSASKSQRNYRLEVRDKKWGFILSVLFLVFGFVLFFFSFLRGGTVVVVFLMFC